MDYWLVDIEFCQFSHLFVTSCQRASYVQDFESTCESVIACYKLDKISEVFTLYLYVAVWNKLFLNSNFFKKRQRSHHWPARINFNKLVSIGFTVPGPLANIWRWTLLSFQNSPRPSNSNSNCPALSFWPLSSSSGLWSQQLVGEGQAAHTKLPLLLPRELKQVI